MELDLLKARQRDGLMSANKSSRLGHSRIQSPITYDKTAISTPNRTRVPQIIHD